MPQQPQLTRPRPLPLPPMQPVPSHRPTTPREIPRVPPNPALKPGDDVTALMSEPPVGTDVSHLFPDVEPGRKLIEFRGRVHDVPAEATDAQIADLLQRIMSGEFADESPISVDEATSARTKHPHAQVAEGALGAAKSVGRALLGLAELINRMSPQQVDLSPIRAVFEPEGTAQHVGAAIGDVASAIAPAGAITRGARLAAGLVPQAARAGVRAGVEGLGAATVAAAQGNDPRIAGAFGAAGPVVGAALRPVAAGAEDAMVKALGPAGRSGPSARADLLTARRHAPELLNRGFRASSQEVAADKAATALQNASRRLDQAWAAVPADRAVPTTNLVNLIERSKKRLIVETQSGGIIPAASQTEHALLSRIQDEIRSLGDTASPQQLRKLRQAYDSAVNYGQHVTATDAVNSRVYAKAADLIRAQIGRHAPEVAAANREFKFWKDISGILAKSIERPDGPTGLGRQIGSTTAGALAGGAVGNLGGAALGAVVVQRLARAMGTPGWRYVSANARRALATALDSGKPEAISTALGPVMAQIANGLKSKGQ